MVRYLLLLFAFLLSGSISYAQTSLSGKVTEEANGEPILFGNVALYKNGNLVTGVETDFDGNYSVANIDPGTYDVEASYIGFQTQRVAGVKVFAGKANQLDINLSAGGINLEEVVVVDYKVPLIEQDNTTQGGSLTSDQIKNLPTRNINALAANVAGLASADEGGEVAVRGSRSNATNYYVDGIRVQGSLIPESEIDQLQVITGGIQAQYGDVTGGIISITTKGPSNKFAGGVEAETSEFLDPYRQSLVGFNVSGPLLKKKDTDQSILGFRVAGRYTYQFDDDPNAVDVYQLTDEARTRLQDRPIRTINGLPFNEADYLGFEDVNVLNAQPNESYTRYDLTAKLDARLSDAIDVTFTGAGVLEDDFFTPGETSRTGANWRVLNSHNNPLQKTQTLRGNFRFRHRLGGASASNGGDAETTKSALIQNASYTLQFGYENELNNVEDTRHGENYFRYGHVGTYDIEWVPSFDFDFINQVITHTDYRQVLRGYAPSIHNPTLSNYNRTLEDIGFNFSEGLNGQIGNSIVFVGGNATVSPSISRDQFIAPNGNIPNVFESSWGFHNNIGTVFNLVRRADDDIVTFNANSSFDLVPGGSENGRHSIQFGILYEQRTTRRYDVNPRNLWDV
ncbi:MAG: carboxypeptidase regulatory-like domain-containing protein, partial [Bacteroidota bacterium]